MSQILINDIFHELKEENNRLLNELLLAQKCVHLLEKYRNCLISFDKNCKCNQNINNNINNKLVFDLLEKDFNEYQSLRTIEDIIECNNKGINSNESEDQLSEQSLEQFMDKKIEKKSINGSQTQPKDEDFGSDYKAINCNESVDQILYLNSDYCRLKCPISGCKESFTLFSDLKKHQNQHQIKHKNNNKSFIKNKDFIENEDKLFCKKEMNININYNTIGVNIKTENTNELIEDKNNNLGLNRYKCPIIGCHKSFASKCNVYSHQKIVHSSEKSIICEFIDCEKRFKTISSMKSHLKLHFYREKNFVCDYTNCQFKTVSETALKTHKIKHTTDRPYSCTIEGCDKSFKYDNSYRSHLLTHFPDNNSISFKCNFNGCEKSFKSHYYLIKHEKRHKNELPVLSCDWPGCEFSTYRKDCLQKHRIGVHSSESNYVCDWPECGKRFKLKEKLKLHQRIHNNDKRFVCHWPGCQYRCVDSGNIHKHFKTHSKKCPIN